MITIVESNAPFELGYAVSAEDSLIDCLTTPFGSVIGKREYGTNFHLLKHRNFDTSWIIDFKIVKDDGEEYAEASINAILSNSNVENNPTSNLNKKVLKSNLNELGKKVYHF